MCPRGRSVPRTDGRSGAGCPRRSSDAAPLSARQLRALLAAAARELAWGLPAVAREVRGWRELAAAIPDQPIRADALDALSRKRGQTDGAALFSILPRARNADLLRLLVAYQITWDFLDSVNEHAASRENGLQLHLALVEALDPSRSISDYYRHHPWHDDGGYLRALVECCRESCRRLPSYERVAALVVREATRAQVLALNHDADAERRDAALRAWARTEFPAGHEASWFELSGAASAGLTIFALLVLGSEPSCSDADIAGVQRAYFPWTGATATMLDSYVDEAEDTANGDHSYVAHYATPELAVERIGQLLRRCLGEARALRDSERHTLIVACMVAMYLSKDSARTQQMRPRTRRLASAGGSLTNVLLPVLRLWRIAYAQRSH